MFRRNIFNSVYCDAIIVVKICFWNIANFVRMIIERIFVFINMTKANSVVVITATIKRFSFVGNLISYLQIVSFRNLTFLFHVNS